MIWYKPTNYVLLNRSHTKFHTSISNIFLVIDFIGLKQT